MTADTITLTPTSTFDALGLGRGPLHVVGQSLGGVIATLMDRERPELIDRMVLCEAVVFPADMERPPDRPQMGEIARRRRAVWPDREEMRARFSSRSAASRSSNGGGSRRSISPTTSTCSAVTPSIRSGRRRTRSASYR